MIYLLTKKGYIGYDEFAARVVRASSPDEARKIANKNTRDEGPCWTDKKQVSCRRIKSDGVSKEILTDFKAC